MSTASNRFSSERERETGPRGAGSRVEVVRDAGRCRQIVRSLVRAREPVAMDAEGVLLGPEGPMTLLQIGTMAGQVYLFDVHQNKDLMDKGRLKRLLESPDVLKVTHSCPSDSGALYFQFDVTLNNVFDTQAANLVIETHVNGDYFPRYIKLEDLVTKYGGRVSEAKALKEKWKDIKDYWERRPLTPEMIAYAAEDVLMLIPTVYNNMNRLIEENDLEDELEEYVEEMINEHMDEERVREQRVARRKDAVEKVLAALERKCRHQQPTLSNLSENEVTALWFVNKEKKISGKIKDLAKTQKLKFLSERREALLDNLETFLEEMKQIKIFGKRLYYLAKDPDEQIQKEAKQIQTGIQVAKACRAVRRAVQDDPMTDADKFLIFNIDDNLMPDEDSLENARSIIAEEFEQEIAPILGRRSGNVKHLDKAEKALLCTIPTCYFQNRVTWQARGILKKRRSKSRR